MPDFPDFDRLSHRIQTIFFAVALVCMLIAGGMIGIAIYAINAFSL
jgi:hypothetical protein